MVYSMNYISTIMWTIISSAIARECLEEVETVASKASWPEMRRVGSKC